MASLKAKGLNDNDYHDKEEDESTYTVLLIHFNQSY